MGSIFTAYDNTKQIAPEWCGTDGAQPASGTLTINKRRLGDEIIIDITGTAFRLTVTDAAGSGSSASHKVIGSVPAGYYACTGSYKQTAAAEGSALTTAAGDAAYIVAFGTVAANAGDGALTGTEVDILAATSTITNSSGTATGSKYVTTAVGYDGAAAAFDIYLNWSGSAATIDANSTIDLTFTAKLVLRKMTV